MRCSGTSRTSTSVRGSLAAEPFLGNGGGRRCAQANATLEVYEMRGRRTYTSDEVLRSLVWAKRTLRPSETNRSAIFSQRERRSTNVVPSLTEPTPPP